MTNDPFWLPHRDSMVDRYPPRTHKPGPEPGQDFVTLTDKHGKPSPAPSNRGPERPPDRR